MSKNDVDKLVDAVMGEAVLSLLESVDEVSFDALITQLQENLTDETDSERREAFRSAINGVHHFRNQPVPLMPSADHLSIHRQSSLSAFAGSSSASKQRKH